jgi:hypothetical protein
MKKRGLVIFSLFLFLSFAVAIAQTGQTGAINGTVTDEEKEALPGVTVTLKSPALILPQIGTVTNEKGIYRFPALPPGLYDLMFDMPGMTGVVRQGLKLNVGQTLSVEIVMRAKALEETVVVVGQAPTLDKESITGATNLDKLILSSIPAERDLGTYFALTPGVTNEPTKAGETQNWGNTAFGSSVRDNAFNLDGVNLQDPLVGTQNVEFGMDVMEELSVEAGGLPAEYGGVKGAVVNVVTKSGGNTFSGSAAFFFKNHSLQSDNSKGTPLEGTQGGFKQAFEPTFSLGGPLAKDRLWFFASFAYKKLSQYAPAGFPYGGDTSVEHTIELDSYFPYLKLTLQPGQKDKISLSYNYSGLTTPQEGQNAFNSEDTVWRRERMSHVVNLQWTHFFSSAFLANVKAAYLDSNHNLKPNKKGTMWIDLVTGAWTGAISFDDLFHDPRLQVNADATYFVDDLAGSHEFKAGGEFTRVEGTRTGNIYSDNPDYYFGYKIFGTPYLGIYQEPFSQKSRMVNVSGFVQDTWSITKKLVLNLGVRVSHQRGIIPKQNESAVDRSFLGVTYNQAVLEDFTPLKWTILSPRLGLIYDIMGDGKTLFKASYSRYDQANLLINFMDANPNVPLGYGFLLLPDGTPIPDAYYFVSFPKPGHIGYKNHDVKAPYLDEVTVGIQREIVADFSLGIRYIRKWDRNLVHGIDANSLDADRLMDDGELVWKNWEQVSFTDPYDGSPQTVWNQLDPTLQADLFIVNPPGADRDYDGVEVTLSKRYSHGWTLMSSYVYSNSRGLIATEFAATQPSGVTGLYNWFANPNSHINAIGRFPLERRHLFQLYGAFEGPLGINFGGSFRAMSGQRYTRTLNTINAGLTLNQAQEQIYGEKKGSRGYPAQVILDIKVEKVFRLGGSRSLAAFIDGFNIFNGNKAVEVQTESGSPVMQFEQVLAIMQPRIFRVGVRFEF